MSKDDLPKVKSPTSEKVQARDGGGNDDASKEAGKFAEGKSSEVLKAEANKNEHDRNQNFKDNYENIVIFGMFIFSGGLFLTFCIRLFHLLSPSKLHWLTEGQIGVLQSLLTGGILIGAVADHLKKRMK